MKKTLFIMLVVVLCVAFAVPAFAGGEKEEVKMEEADPLADLSAADKAIVERAIRLTNERTKTQTEWYGPTSGPKLAPDKFIVFLGSNFQNHIVKVMADYTERLGAEIGWRVVSIDGKGTVDAWISGFNQAIAMNPDGILIDANAEVLQVPIKEANAKGIPVTGMHALHIPGPVPEYGLLYNSTTKPSDIGAALADYIIAHSNGKGKAIVLYDALYAIARAKAEAMRDRFLESGSVELLEYANYPIAEVPTQMPQIGVKWVQEHPKPFYVMTIADYYYDFMVPSLRAGGVPMEDVVLLGSDAPPSAYDRIRNEEYQIVSIPEPWDLFVYQCFDAMNRFFHGQEPYTWHQPVFCIDPSNVEEEGGMNDEFIPSNGYQERYKKIWGVM
jgi:ribose transport system substrate-binding protein